MSAAAEQKKVRNNTGTNRGSNPSAEEAVDETAAMFAELGFGNPLEGVGALVGLSNISGEPLKATTRRTNSDKIVAASLNSFRTRQLISKEGEAARATTERVGEESIGATLKVGKQIATQITNLSGAINKALNQLNDNIILGQQNLQSMLKDLNEAQIEAFQALNTNFNTGFKAIVDNQKLTAEEMKAALNKLTIEFGKGLSGIDDKLGKVSDKMLEGFLALGAQIGDLKLDLDRQLQTQKAELEKLREASKKPDYDKYKQTKIVYVCPYCRGFNHAGQCAVTGNGSLSYGGGFILEDRFKRVLPVAILEAIQGALQTNVSGPDVFRIRHNLNLSADLRELDAVVAEYQAGPDAFIEKYVIRKTPLPIARI